MKRLTSLVLGLVAAALLAGPGLGSPAGDLDRSFDGDGKRIVANPYMATEVLVQPDGKILVVGNGSANDFAVTRVGSDGSIDRGYVARPPPFRRAGRGGFRNVRGSFAVDARAGANRVRFAGRLTARRRLAPGDYRINATPVDAVGNAGAARRATFTVLPARL